MQVETRRERAAEEAAAARLTGGGLPALQWQQYSLRQYPHFNCSNGCCNGHRYPFARRGGLGRGADQA
jgi:hypothetical protein